MVDEEITYDTERIEEAIKIARELGWKEITLRLSGVPLVEKRKKIKAPILIIAEKDEYSGIFVCPIVRKPTKS